MLSGIWVVRSDADEAHRLSLSGRVLTAETWRVKAKPVPESGLRGVVLQLQRPLTTPPAPLRTARWGIASPSRSAALGGAPGRPLADRKRRQRRYYDVLEACDSESNRTSPPTGCRIGPDLEPASGESCFRARSGSGPRQTRSSPIRPARPAGSILVVVLVVFVVVGRVGLGEVRRVQLIVP